MNDPRIPQKILYQTVFILLASTVLALLANSLRPGGIRFFGADKPAPEPPAAAANETEAFRAISLEAALAVHGSDNVLFADARPMADYEAGHIAGALHLPVNRFETWIDAFIEAIGPAAAIITYCDGPHCPLAQQLYFAGYDNVRHLPNGWPRWREAGGPDAYGPP